MTNEKLDKKIISIWYITAGIFAVLFLLVCLIAILFLSSLILKSIIVGLMVLLTGFTLIYPVLRYRSYSYGYDERRIYIRYGVIFKHEIIIPIRQLQDLHLYQGPIMTAFDVQSLILSTAGSNFSITGLKKEDAMHLAEQFEELLQKRLDDEEVS